MRTKIASIGMRDLEKQCFCTGGPGGQNQNRNKNGVRLVHKVSGAIGESREFKSQAQNTKAALKRLAETVKFKMWSMSLVNKETSEEWVEKEMKKELNFKIEIRDKDKWVEE